MAWKKARACSRRMAAETTRRRASCSFPSQAGREAGIWVGCWSSTMATATKSSVGTMGVTPPGWGTLRMASARRGWLPSPWIPLPRETIPVAVTVAPLASAWARKRFTRSWGFSSWTGTWKSR
ncbi:MAG: hypothetical protein ACI4Q0_08165 [Oligosphaeraceae bacterium]